MAILSTSQILDYIRNFIKSKYPQVDAQPGTDLYDLIFSSSAQIARRVFEEIERLQKNQVITTTYSKDLDLIARNYNVIRRPATYATGEVTFYTSSFSADVSIPVGTVVSTGGTNVTSPVRFKTNISSGMNITNKAIYFDSTAARYQIQVPIIAEIAGSAGDIDAQIITQLVTSVSEISGVTNAEATTGGTEEETDTSLQQRCLESFLTSSVGTIYGYKKTLQDNYEEVTDVTALGPFDTDAIRNTGVDIFVILSSINSISNTTQITESFTYATGDSGYTPIYRPVESIDALNGTSLGSPRSYIPYPNVDADYQFIKDYTGERALSTGSGDKITWMPLGVKPDNGTSVAITYTYNQKVQDLQEFMDEEENKVVGADAAIKLGFKAKAYLTLTVSYFSNVDTDAAEQKVSAALSQFLSEMKFNEDLELSDLIIVAQTGKFTDYLISEVDYIVFDETQCYITIEGLGTTRYSSNGVIMIGVNEYVREGLITIV